MNLIIKNNKPPDPVTRLHKTRCVVSGNRSKYAGASEMISMILERMQQHQGGKLLNASVLGSENFIWRLDVISHNYKDSEQDITMAATYVTA